MLPEGRISPEDLGIWKDEHCSGVKANRWISYMHKERLPVFNWPMPDAKQALTHPETAGASAN